MKPIVYQKSANAGIFQNISDGLVVAKIKGSVKKLGEQYKDATLVLYSKVNLQPIAIKKAKENGDYQFLNLNNKIKTFIIAFDNKNQYNAVIQDNMVPK